MKAYLDLLRDVYDNGVGKNDRTGTGTRSVFGRQIRCDLSEGFPLLTTKKVFLRGIIHELLWFIRGDTNIKYLVDNNVGIWNEWPYQNYLNKNGFGNLEKHSCEWEERLDEFVINIHTSRRLIVSAWNPAEIEEMAKAGLPPCHTLFQFYVSHDKKLSCQLYQRSADLFLGVPFNIASYALLTMMVAQVCKLELGDFVHAFGDVHIYNNHQDQVREQLSRSPTALPTIKLNTNVESLLDFKFDDFKLIDYASAPSIKAPVAI